MATKTTSNDSPDLKARSKTTSYARFCDFTLEPSDETDTAILQLGSEWRATKELLSIAELKQIEIEGLLKSRKDPVAKRIFKDAALDAEIRADDLHDACDKIGLKILTIMSNTAEGLLIKAEVMAFNASSTVDDLISEGETPCGVSGPALASLLFDIQRLAER